MPDDTENASSGTAFFCLVLAGKRRLIGSGAENIGNGTIIDIDSAFVGELDAFAEEKHGGGVSSVQVQGITAAGFQKDIGTALEIRTIRMNFSSFDEQGDKVASSYNAYGAPRFKVCVRIVTCSRRRRTR